MKRFLAFLLAAVMCLSMFAACKDKQSDTTGDGTPDTGDTGTAPDTGNNDTPQNPDGGNTDKPQTPEKATFTGILDMTDALTLVIETVGSEGENRKGLLAPAGKVSIGGYNAAGTRRNKSYDLDWASLGLEGEAWEYLGATFELDITDEAAPKLTNKPEKSAFCWVKGSVTFADDTNVLLPNGKTYPIEKLSFGYERPNGLLHEGGVYIKNWGDKTIVNSSSGKWTERGGYNYFMIIISELFDQSLAIAVSAPPAGFGAVIETPEDNPTLINPELKTDKVETVAPLAAGNDKTEGWPEYTITYWGDSTITANFMGDMIAAFGKADGIIINSIAQTYTNIQEFTTYNLYETCTFTGEAPNYESVAAKTSGTNASRLFNGVKTSDFFVVLAGRDRSLTDNSAGALRTRLALQEWRRIMDENNPNGEMVLFVPYGFNNAPADWTMWSKLPFFEVMDRQTHNALIKQYAAELAAAIDNKCSMIQMGDAYETFIAAHSDIDLYDGITYRFPSIAGSYYSACVIYASLFDRSPVGMEVYCGLDAETAKLIQNEAHKFVFGTDPATVKREGDKDPGKVIPTVEDARLATGDEIDTRFSNEVYPENFNVLMSALYAYEARAPWVQYDNMNFDRVNKTYNRRTVENAAPEDGTPQEILYTDCSAWLYGAFMDTFNWGFNGANRVNQMVKQTDLQVYFWSYNETDILLEDAIKTFVDTLQPGDVYLYTNYDNFGHVMVYAGNGKFIHCAGRHATGGGENYYFESDTDAWEYDGAIIWDPIDSVISESGWLYMFQKNCEVAILRPLALDLVPTENAINRMNNMQGIVSYKHTTAPEGVTVNSGDDVTFTFIITNYNAESKTLDISDTLAAGLTYKSGNGKFENGKFTATVTVAPGETVEVAYTATVNAANGTVVECDEAFIGGVRTNKTNVNVAKTLTSAEQTKFAEAVKNGAAADAYTLASDIYKNTFGVTLPTLEEAIASLFRITAAAGDKQAFSNLVTDFTGSKILAANLIGGQNYSYTATDPIKRIKHISAQNFVIGDILIYNTDGTAATASVFVYVGDGQFATVENGAVKVLSKANSLALTECLMGKFNFCVLRPSIMNGSWVAGDGETDEPKVNPDAKRVLVVGDMMLSLNDFGKVLDEMLGWDYTVYSEAYFTASPKNGGSRLEIFELFQYEGTNCIGWKTSGNARYTRLAEYFAAGDPDYIVLNTGRRDAINTSGEKAKSVIKWLSETYPNTKLVIFSDQPYAEAGFASIGTNYTGSTPAEHNDRIKAFAASAVEGIANAKLLQAGDAFMEAVANNLSVYGEEGAYIVHPNTNGTYMLAAMACAAITGTTKSEYDASAIADAEALAALAAKYTPQPKKVLVFGDMIFGLNEFDKLLGEQLGWDYLVYSEAYLTSSPKNGGSRLEIVDFFQYEGTTCIGWKEGSETSRYRRIINWLAENQPDYLVLSVGRRDAINTSGDKVKSVIKWLSETYSNAKLIVFADQPYTNGAFSSIGTNYTGTNDVEHNDRIKAFAVSATEGLANAVLLQAGDKFLAAKAQNIAVYGEEGAYIVHPNNAGTYLLSCMAYSAITGNPATGLAAGDIADAAALQALADAK